MNFAIFLPFAKLNPPIFIHYVQDAHQIIKLKSTIHYIIFNSTKFDLCILQV